jgi:hypothetical protein
MYYQIYVYLGGDCGDFLVFVEGLCGVSAWWNVRGGGEE